MTSVDMDARQFVRQAAREAPRAFHHIVMNLPASSIEFLGTCTPTTYAQSQIHTNTNAHTRGFSLLPIRLS
jgi:tRNA G37 N-methylase Trm5